MLYESEQKCVFSRRISGKSRSSVVRQWGLWVLSLHTIQVPVILGRLLNISIVQLFRSKCEQKSMCFWTTNELAITKHNKVLSKHEFFHFGLWSFLCFLWYYSYVPSSWEKYLFAFFILSIMINSYSVSFLNNSLWGGGGEHKHFWG